MAEVVVVGAGIAGLAAAHALGTWAAAHPAAGLRARVVEADGRAGGKLRTSTLAGRPVDEGPDAFLARLPWAVGLVRDLGLGDELVSPASGAAWVYSRGRLRRLPEGLLLGVPVDLVPLVRSGLLSPWGVARAGLEPLAPRRDHADSLGRLIRARFGAQVLERLVDPLLGGIYAGDADRLSLAAGAPQIAEAAARHRSLFLGLRRQRASTPPPTKAAPVFHALRSGMQRWVDALEAELGRLGVPIAYNVRVAGVGQAAGGGLTLDTGTGPGPAHADAVVLATPGHVAARQLGDAPAAAAWLQGLPHASVALVSLVLPDAALGRPLDGSGLLVPKPEQRTLTACSWATTKWPHWKPEGHSILRASAGRFGDERALALDDSALVDAVRADLARLMGLRGDPVEVRVSRWVDAFPQYLPGHNDRVDAFERDLAAALPGVACAGSAYRGIGIPACIRQGQEAARRALAHLGLEP